jgi:hypothetical protein
MALTPDHTLSWVIVLNVLLYIFEMGTFCAQKTLDLVLTKKFYEHLMIFHFGMSILLQV